MQAPNGEHFASWKQVKEFCQQNGIRLPADPSQAAAVRKPVVDLQDIIRALHKLAEGYEGKFVGPKPAVQEGLLRARQVRCVKRKGRSAK